MADEELADESCAVVAVTKGESVEENKDAKVKQDEKDDEETVEDLLEGLSSGGIVTGSAQALLHGGLDEELEEQFMRENLIDEVMETQGVDNAAAIEIVAEMIEEENKKKEMEEEV